LSTLRILVAMIALFAVTVPVWASELVGRVVGIADGDTLTALVSGKQIKVRLLDIDSPERKQPFYARSRQSLAEICAGKATRIEWAEKDRYRRVLGRVYCAGIDANAEKVRRGMAWVFTRYAPKDSPLYAIQAEARRAERGLWTDSQPVAPWDWRARNRASK
jgi:endonuclease YncB( thermonuclease family)